MKVQRPIKSAYVIYYNDFSSAWSRVSAGKLPDDFIDANGVGLVINPNVGAMQFNTPEEAEEWLENNSDEWNPEFGDILEVDENGELYDLDGDCLTSSRRPIKSGYKISPLEWANRWIPEIYDQRKFIQLCEQKGISKIDSDEFFKLMDEFGFKSNGKTFEYDASKYLYNSRKITSARYIATDPETGEVLGSADTYEEAIEQWGEDVTITDSEVAGGQEETGLFQSRRLIKSENKYGADIDRIYEKQLNRIKKLRAKGYSDDEIDDDEIVRQTKEDMRNVGKIKSSLSEKFAMSGYERNNNNINKIFNSAR